MFVMTARDVFVGRGGGGRVFVAASANKGVN